MDELVVVAMSRKNKGNRVGKEPVQRSKRARYLPMDDASDGGDTCPEWCCKNGLLPVHMQQACCHRHVIWGQSDHALLGRSCCGPCVRAQVDQCFVAQALACVCCTSFRNPCKQCLAEPPAIATPDSGSPGVVVPCTPSYGGLRGDGML